MPSDANRARYHMSHNRIGKHGASPIPVLHRFSRATQERTRRALVNAWAPSTLDKYESSVNAFLRFCDAEGIEDVFRLPANEQLLCAYAATFAGVAAGGTASGALAAVRAWHIISDAKWKGGLNLSYVLKGVAKLAPGSSKRPPRPPTSIEMIECLDDHLDKSNPKDACILFGVKSGVWGQLRCGEMLSEWVNSYTEKGIPLVSDVHKIPAAPDSVLINLPSTKCNRIKGESIILCSQFGSTNPVAALENHLRVNDLPADAPLMSFRDGKGKLQCLTKRTMFARANEVWTKNGFAKTTGHSLRIGGTTLLLMCGVPPDIVKTMGRWKSDAFLAYWRATQIIVPVYSEYLELPRVRY